MYCRIYSSKEGGDECACCVSALVLYEMFANLIDLGLSVFKIPECDRLFAKKNKQKRKGNDYDSVIFMDN